MTDFRVLRDARRLEETAGVVIATGGALFSLLGRNLWGVATCGAGLAGFLAWLWWTSSRLENRAAWPIVDGFVESSKVARRASGDFSVFGVELSYSYRTQGDYYSREFFQPCGSEAEADELAAVLRRDTKVMVQYHPEKPEDSILDVEVQAGARGLTLSSALLIALVTAAVLMGAFVIAVGAGF